MTDPEFGKSESRDARNRTFAQVIRYERGGSNRHNEGKHRRFLRSQQFDIDSVSATCTLAAGTTTVKVVTPMGTTSTVSLTVN